jgi:hypothetical protein
MNRENRGTFMGMTPWDMAVFLIKTFLSLIGIYLGGLLILAACVAILSDFKLCIILLAAYCAYKIWIEGD